MIKSALICVGSNNPPHLFALPAPLDNRCTSFSIQASSANSATVRWYQRPSEHSTQPRIAPALTLRQVFRSRPRPAALHSAASSSSRDAAGTA